jgi:hypothetical protein
VNARKTLAGPKNTRSATRFICASRFELPLLGSNQDSPDPESGVLPVTPRGSEPVTRPVLPSLKPQHRHSKSAPVLMELRGLEPLTSWVRSRRSPS